MKAIDRVFACLALVCVCAVADARDVVMRQLTLNIDAQRMIDALHEWAQQTGFQLVVSEGEWAQQNDAPSVKGEFTPEGALQSLLQGTPLTFEFVNERTVVVHARRAKSKPSSSAIQMNRPALRLAAATLDEGRAGASVANAEMGDASSVESRDAKHRRNIGLEEVVVTAQKREERLIDVPISIIALGDEELKQRHITNVDDLSSAVPGLAVQSGSGQRRITLRGVSNFSGGSSLIGLYLDEASVTAPSPVAQLDLRTYDLERIEVLRGPQGTLYGEGSVGGTVRFITKNPLLDGFSISGDVAATFTEDGSPGQRVEAAVNVPLIADQLGLRIAGTMDHQGGWMDQPAAGREDFNDQNLTDVRIKGLWQPTSQFRANVMTVIHRNDPVPNNGEDADGNFRQTFNLTSTPTGEVEYEIYNLTLTYDFDAFRILNTTSYSTQERRNRNLGYRLPLTPPAGRPAFDVFFADQWFQTDTLTEELRLTSSGKGPWQWTIGGFYRDAEFDSNGLAHVGLPGPAGTPLPPGARNLVNNQFKSWAIFGDTSYKFADRFTIGAGLRYFEDDQEYATGFGVFGPVQKETFDSVNPRFYAQYEITDDVNTYVTAARGFRSGGFNALNQPAYDPESIWTYELGTKMSLFEKRLRTDLALFYTDYTNYQIAGILPPPAPLAAITSNAGSAKVKGVELGLQWYPVDQWSLSLNGSYVKSKFYEIDATSSSHRVGDPLDLFPKYGYSIATQRDFTWFGRDGFARLDYNEQGRSTFRNRRFGPWYFSESDKINMLNFNSSLQWSDRLSLGLFAQNLLNDRGRIDPMSIQEFAARSRPRTFGVQAGYTFD